VPQPIPLQWIFNTIDGTAIAGIDYVAQTGTLTFGPLERVKPVVIPTLRNPASKKEKSFSLVLTNASQGSLLGVHADTTLTIVPQQLLSIRYASNAAGPVVRLTLTPTTAGIWYRLEGSSSPTLSTSLGYTNQTRLASEGGSLEFEDNGGAAQRFYRASRLGP